MFQKQRTVAEIFRGIRPSLASRVPETNGLQQRLSATAGGSLLLYFLVRSSALLQ